MNVLLTALIATAFVVAASAWPSDYHYGMTAAYGNKLTWTLVLILIQACVW